MTVPWTVTPLKVKALIEKIVEFSKHRKVILFGSYVTGNMTIDSDIDVLVVERVVENPRKESVRIRHALKGLLMPIDILSSAGKRIRKNGGGTWFDLQRSS